MKRGLLKLFLFLLIVISCSVTTKAEEYGSVHVSTLTELKAALNNPLAQVIYLDQDIDFPNNATSDVPVDRSVTIDGQNHVITNAGAGIATYGFHFSTNNIDLTFRNVKFGDQATNRSFSNYWGIAYGAVTGQNQTINVENVSYYSNYFGQPFFLPNATDKITFSGNNTFTQDSGVGTQEWAEASNFLFKSGSNTVINHQTSEAGGFIWSTSSLNFTLEDDAKVDISTNHYFSWSDQIANNLTVGKNSQLKIQQTNPSKGTFSQRIDGKYNIEAKENSRLEIITPKASRFNGGTITLQPGAVGIFHTNDSSFFNRISQGPIFQLNNPKNVTFQADTQSNDNPIGLNSNENLKFSPFTPGIAGLGIYVNDSQIDLQTQPYSWSVGSDISRDNWDFSITQKAIFHAAQKIAISALGKIDFDGNGGTPATQEKTGLIGANVNIADLNVDTPHKEYSTFAGWSTEKDNFNTKVDTVVPNYEGVTLYALWIANSVALKKVDDFSFGSQVINGHNQATATAEVAISDHLNAADSGGWQLLAKYDAKDQATQKWLANDLSVTFKPIARQSFVKTPDVTTLTSDFQLVAQVTDEKQKGSQTEQTIALNPTLSAPAKVQVGSYQATINWSLVKSPT